MSDHYNQEEKYRLTPNKRDSDCQNCPLCRNELKVVSTEYHGKRPRILFIAEAPGREENGRGRPAIGVTGKILRSLVKKINGGEEVGMAYGNIVRCRPTAGSDRTISDRKPTEAEMGYCRHFLYRDIERLDPQYIVLLGDIAAHALATDPITGEAVSQRSGIHVLRGKDYVVRTPSGKKYPATATYHFAYVSRSPGEGGVFHEDVSKALWRTRSDYTDWSYRGKKAIILDTVSKVKKFLHKLRTGLTKKDIVALDFETKGLRRLNTELLCIGFAYGPDQGYVIPYNHKDTPWKGKSFQRIKQLFKQFFSAKHFSFGAMVAHNLKFEISIIMDKWGVVPIDVPWECTLLRANSLNENRGSDDEDERRGGSAGYKLKNLVEEWLQFYHYHDKDIDPTVVLRNADQLASAKLEDLAEYNAMDCYAEWRLYSYERYVAKLQGRSKSFRRLHRRMLGPTSVFASWLERNGMGINKARLRYLIGGKSPILTAMRGLEYKLNRRSSVKRANQLMLSQSKATQGLTPLWESSSTNGGAWVFGLSKPMARYTLFIDVLKLPRGEAARGKEATKKGLWRINKAFFERYDHIPEVAIIAEWSGLQKLYSTYIKGVYDRLQSDPDMADGRVRGRLNLARAVTGRTTFSDPNLQNIPSRGKTDASKSIKKLFRAARRRLIVVGDYSQAEVRWLAEITGDEKLIAEFIKVAKILDELERHPSAENALRAKLEGDFHRRTSSMMFNVAISAITKAQRTQAKEVLFGQIYGQGIRSLAARIAAASKEPCSAEQAEDFQKRLFAQFPSAEKWLYQIEKMAYRDGFVESPFGRRRHLLSQFLVTPDLASDHWRKKIDPDHLSPVLKNLVQFLGDEDRQARNSPIQGVASDTNLLACIALLRYIVENDLDWLIVNVVHDSILGDIAMDDVEEYVVKAKATMQDPHLFDAFGYRSKVPFVADFSLGPNWGNQYDILPLTTWSVRCKHEVTVGKGKKKETKVCGEHDVYEPRKPRRCPSCGERDVTVALAGGPVSVLLTEVVKLHPEITKSRRQLRREEQRAAART